MSEDVAIRPLTDADVPAAQEMSYAALSVAGQRYGWDMPELDETRRERGRVRIQHCLAHDPHGAFVADREGEIVGIALATRRGPLWFLSLLSIRTDLQNQGIGRRLLEASMGTLEHAGMICASDDPKALRRYRTAGFDLLPCYEAKGVVDRSRLPAGTSVRQVSYDEGRDFVEHVACNQRGAPHGPDLDLYASSEWPLLIVDDATGRGYCVTREFGSVVIAATAAEPARRLLWNAFALATEPEVELSWVTHDQQWAVDVALEARLPIHPRGSQCRMRIKAPMQAYVPNGAFG